jgi:hypothetical protein
VVVVDLLGSQFGVVFLQAVTQFVFLHTQFGHYSMRQVPFNYIPHVDLSLHEVHRLVVVLDPCLEDLHDWIVELEAEWVLANL